MANKFLVALVTALATAATLTVDGNLSLRDGILIAQALVGALAVYQISNTPPTNQGAP